MAWLDAGIRLLQLRAKSLQAGEMLALAEGLAARTRVAGALFVINDRLDVAILAGADGVHVGQQDLRPYDVRHAAASVPSAKDLLVGYSTHDDVQLRSALDEPLSYVAFGPVFATTTKAEPDPLVGLAGVQQAARRTRAARVPLVAIGGIERANARDVIAAGADVVAIASDLTSPDDPRGRAREWLDLLGEAPARE